jgi:hypothetical protein
VQIELYSRAEGVEVLDGGGASLAYEIPAGEAIFLVSGASGDANNRFMAANATSIWVIPQERGGWEVDTFLLEYEDGNHEQWSLMLKDSQWR